MAVFQFPAELTVYQAAEVQQGLLRALDEGAPQTLDLSGVTEIDTAGLQLLLLAKREAARRGLAFSFVNASAPVREVLQTLAIGEL